MLYTKENIYTSLVTTRYVCSAVEAAPFHLGCFTCLVLWLGNNYHASNLSFSLTLLHLSKQCLASLLWNRKGRCLGGRHNFELLETVSCYLRRKKMTRVPVFLWLLLLSFSEFSRNWTTTFIWNVCNKSVFKWLTLLRRLMSVSAQAGACFELLDRGRTRKPSAGHVQQKV